MGSRRVRNVSNKVRIAIYGCGNWANRTHIPNLLRIENAEIVALCDIDPRALRSTAERFGIFRTYRDGHEMLASKEIDALFSVVRARARTDVESTAAQRGVHLFSEKPQAETMEVANRIAHAVQQSGVVSTVGFRERYRPLFQRAREYLADKEIVHIRLESIYGVRAPLVPGRGASCQLGVLPDDMAMSWGVHAVDCIRFMTGLNVTQAQGFQLRLDRYPIPIAQSLHFRLTNGAAVTVTFVESRDCRMSGLPSFDVYYEGGRLSIRRHDRSIWSMDIDGQNEYRDEFDPWLAQDRLFVEAVRRGNDGLLLNDYQDGLYSLAPILAARESAHGDGACIDVEAFMG